jgi:hypothetical protein
MERSELTRLEDFVQLAKEGKKIQVEIELEKQDVIEKLPGKEVYAYLFVANYVFKHKGETTKIPKVYIMGFRGEPLDLINANKNIANARLKMDYQRLREEGIKFEEKLF